eukprot:TRINITY_DN1455_c0_g1_i1.p1 TRINITY_DN1455_c0_g1~~TRINITY_DN1455_c0_g1_i1.p1  ORF type:complete len:503 (+),score=139.93 TRINITY_DN1455_c0_g1_i1:417-1925(+)
MNAAGLLNPSTLTNFKVMNADEKFSRAEAAKLLINMLLRISNGDLTADFERLGGLKGLLTLLTDLLARNRDDLDWIGSEDCDSILFPYSRLWFNVARPMPENKKMINDALSEGGITLIGEWLERLFHPQTNSGKRFPNYIPMAASDLVRVLVGLTIDMGPLGENRKDLLVKHIPNFQTLVNTLMSILDINSEVNGTANNTDVPIKNNQLLQFALIVASSLVNVPVDFCPLLLRSDKAKAAKSLCDLFSQQIYQMTFEGPSGLAPQMMLLATVAKADYDVRRHFLKIMFPHRNIDAEEAAPGVHAPGKDEKCVGNHVMELMTHFDLSVKYWSNELLFQMCDENPDRFVKLTGFGNAAGLLVMRNMFGMGRHLNEDTAAQMRDAKKSEKPTQTPSTTTSGSAPAAAASKAGKSAKIQEETEDEEMERLAEKLMMMEQKGLVKIVRKGDKEGEELVRQYQAKQAAAASSSSGSSEKKQDQKGAGMEDDDEDDEDGHRRDVTPSDR